MTQLTLDSRLAAALKEEGLNAIEETDRHFIEMMREAAIKISQSCGFVTTDNLRVIAEKLGMVPKHQNSWGGIMRGPRWKVVGRHRSAIPGNHSREIRVWQYIPD